MSVPRLTLILGPDDGDLLEAMLEPDDRAIAFVYPAAFVAIFDNLPQPDRATLWSLFAGELHRRGVAMLEDLSQCAAMLRAAIDGEPGPGAAVPPTAALASGSPPTSSTVGDGSPAGEDGAGRPQDVPAPADDDPPPEDRRQPAREEGARTTPPAGDHPRTARRRSAQRVAILEAMETLHRAGDPWARQSDIRTAAGLGGQIDRTMGRLEAEGVVERGAIVRRSPTFRLVVESPVDHATRLADEGDASDRAQDDASPVDEACCCTGGVPDAGCYYHGADVDTSRRAAATDDASTVATSDASPGPERQISRRVQREIDRERAGKQEEAHRYEPPNLEGRIEAALGGGPAGPRAIAIAVGFAHPTDELMSALQRMVGTNRVVMHRNGSVAIGGERTQFELVKR